MAQLLDSGIFSAVNTAGAIGVGWKLNFYIVATSTRLDTYPTEADAIASTNPNANPVVVPADGRVPACWLKDQDYKIVLTDENGVVKNTTPVMPAISTRLSFIQAGTNAIARTNQAKTREVMVSITDFTGADATGATDSTAALQSAADSLTGGGIIRIPRNSTFLISMVTISYAHITVELETGATLKKYGSAGASFRGIFKVANLLNAFFTVEGGTIDLNGEGPKGIGVAGRLANTYAAQTIPAIIALSGPANALVYGLRASHITVRNVTIKNTGESAILFRNCSDTNVENCWFENVANYGIEYSMVAAGSDGGSGTMPDRSRHYARRNHFQDIDDRGLSSGNGCGIGGGGTSALGAMYDFVFEDNTFVRCLRDLHMEFTAGAWLERVRVNGWNSTEPGQGSIGFVGVRKGSISRGIVTNPSQAPQLALTYQVGATYPESYALILSGDFVDIDITDVQVIDDRTYGVTYAADGVATAASFAFTSATAAFAAGDVGKVIGIVGAGPSAICHVTTIAARNSATSITLTDACVTSNGTAKYAYGGALRQGIVCTTGTSVTIKDVYLKAGAATGLTAEPATQAAIRLKDITTLAKLDGIELVAPASGTSRPRGLMLTDSGLDAAGASTFTGKLLKATNPRITGFTAAEVGTYLRRSSVIPPNVSFIEDRALAPSATANTYGTEEVIFATDMGTFLNIVCGSFESLNIGAETLTFALTCYYHDGSAGTPATVAVTTNVVTQWTAKTLRAANPDDAPMRAIGVKMKSSIINSLATGKANGTGRQL